MREHVFRPAEMVSSTADSGHRFVTVDRACPHGCIGGWCATMPAKIIWHAGGVFGFVTSVMMIARYAGTYADA